MYVCLHISAYIFVFFCTALPACAAYAVDASPLLPSYETRISASAVSPKNAAQSDRTKKCLFLSGDITTAVLSDKRALHITKSTSAAATTPPPAAVPLLQHGMFYAMLPLLVGSMALCMLFFTKHPQRRPRLFRKHNKCNALRQYLPTTHSFVSVTPDNMLYTDSFIGYAHEQMPLDLKRLATSSPENTCALQTLATLFSTQDQVTLVMELKHAQGHHVHMKLVLRKKSKKLAEGLAYDVSKLLHTEKALKQTTTQYNTIFTNSPIGIYQTDASGRFEQINEAFASLWGADSPEAMLHEINNSNELLWTDSSEERSFLSALCTAGKAENEEFLLQKKKRRNILGAAKRCTYQQW